ncbi:MAG: hypothetical protein QOE70_477 [Chthoniobacter sp.]|jgi:hypothetical protein|nr:hypothetical protein [Chthoniobacter sp.]
MNWYYEQAGERQGPVPDSELDRLLASGAISESTLVWREGMADWAPLAQARPATGAPTEAPPEGWIQCTATGRFFPPSEIVYIDGKPYSAAAKPAVLQGLMQSGSLVTGAETGRTGPPWEHRMEQGFPKAAWETVKAVLLDPSGTFANMKREGGIGSPLLYVVILGSTGAIFGLAYQFIINLGTQSLIPPEARPPGQPGFPLTAGITAGMFVVLAVLMPALIAVGVFIGAGVLHLSLMICGGAKQPFETTFRTYCYSHGSSSVLQIVPVCGALIGAVWGLVCVCIGLSKSHEIGVGRALLAVLLPVLLCCGIAIVFFGAVFAAAMAAQGVHPR